MKYQEKSRGGQRWAKLRIGTAEMNGGHLRGELGDGGLSIFGHLGKDREYVMSFSEGETKMLWKTLQERFTTQENPSVNDELRTQIKRLRNDAELILDTIHLARTKLLDPDRFLKSAVGDLGDIIQILQDFRDDRD